MRIFLLAVTVAACAAIPAFATDLSTESDFDSHSSHTGNTYILDEGDFKVVDQIDMSTGDVIMNKTGTTLTISDPTSSNYILLVNNFTIDAGTLNLRGDTAARALHIRGDFTQNGGTVNAYGGVSSAHAIMDPQNNGTYYMNGGTLTAIAADAYYGIALSLSNYVQTGGDATFRAGDGVQAFGMYGNTTTLLSGGTTSFYGGAGEDAVGLLDTNLFHVSGTADVYAKGGTGDGAFGVQARKMEQTGGVIVAEGGDDTGTNAGLLVTGDVDQTGGVLRAVGSAVDGGYGLYFHGTTGVRTISGTLEIERQGTAASVYSSSGMTFTTGSTLKPIINLNHEDDLVSGLIRVRNASTVTIESDVDLVPELKNVAHLREEHGEVELLFIDATGGSIDGEFNCIESNTLGVTAEKRDGDKYYLTVYRKAEVLDLLKPWLPYRNGDNLFQNMYDWVSENRDCALGRIWDDLEQVGSLSELYALASYIAYTMTPHAYADYTHTVMRMADVTDTDFYRQMQKRVSSAPNLSPVASANSYASLLPGTLRGNANGGLRIWASPLFQQSSRFKNKTPEFGNSKEKFWGGSVGFARDWDRISLGAAVHYLRGDYDTYHASIDSDNYGARAGILIHSLVPCPDSFNPWLQASIGYDYGRLKQKHYDYVGALRTSRPNIDTFRARLEMGNSISLGHRFTVTPKIGVDYTYIRQDGYRERGASDYLLRVYHDRHNSLRPRAGLHLAAAVSPKTELSAWGEYVFETLHTHSEFDSSFVAFPDVRFVTRGENRSRSSGNVGAGLRHRMGRADLAATYDMTMESRYLAHRFGINVSTSF